MKRAYTALTASVLTIALASPIASAQPLSHVNVDVPPAVAAKLPAKVPQIRDAGTGSSTGQVPKQVHGLHLVHLVNSYGNVHPVT